MTRYDDRLRSRLNADTFLLGDALFWKSNRLPVPLHCFRDAGLLVPIGQKPACDLNDTQAIATYKAARAGRTPEQLAEEQLEVLAAFGPGCIVVNILTGERYSV